ncbi:Flp pilus assembly protein CpaB [Lentisphaerota bacterium ZTH]|nr:Flp pilus assembly protein CpaB [Lentisphaerota bacterium]WET05777.1 Flp pilus assembly protein CpaB [Lentisphaerota bacterium ZTH]
MVKRTLKDKLPLITAIILGILSVVAIQRYLAMKTQARKIEQGSILVAAGDISKGTELTQNMLTTRKLPVTAISTVCITVPSDNSPAAVQETTRKKMMLSGRVVKRMLKAGEAIHWTDLQEPSRETLSDKLSAGHRAISIAVDTVTSVGNNIIPGDHVDVIATMQPKIDAMSPVSTVEILQALSNNRPLRSPAAKVAAPLPTTKVILQNVPVIAVGQDISMGYEVNQLHGSPGRYSNITLDVSLEQAVLLTHARQQGAISFILRPRGSFDTLPTTRLIEIDNNNMNKYIREARPPAPATDNASEISK